MEKQYLLENFLNSYDKQYLLEFDGNTSDLKRCMENPDIPIYLYGLIQKGDTPNRNRRIYPMDILRPECERYLAEEVKDLQSFGELDHPEDSTVPSLQNAAMTIEDIWFNGKEVHGKIKILNAFMPQVASGLIARGIVLNGKTLGISSRALGSLYQDGSGYDIVDNDLEIVCWDLVSKPSTIGSNLKAFKKTLGESKLLRESYNGEKVKKIIKESFNLAPEQKIYLDIMGVEKFLQLANK